MKIDDEKFRHYFQKLKKENPKKLAEAIAQLSPEEAEDILYDGKVWLRDNQRFDKYDESIILFNGGRGTGKDLSNSTPILTANRGWSTIGEVKIGDSVYTETGEHAKVIDKYIPPKRKLYKFTFSDKTSLISSEEHDWVTWNVSACKAYDSTRPSDDPFPEDWVNWKSKSSSRFYSDADLELIHNMRQNGSTCGEIGKVLGRTSNAIQQQWNKPCLTTVKVGSKKVTTQEIINTFKYNARVFNHRIPLTKPITSQQRSLPIPPWVMGYLLGDGDTKDGSRVACDKRDKQYLISQFTKYGYKVIDKPKDDMHFRLGNIRDTWKSLDLHLGKYVPEDYLLSSIEDRVELAKGLFDSDGMVNKRGQFIFDNTNKDLINALCSVLTSLGLMPRVYHRKPRVRAGNLNKESWSIVVSSNIELCSLPRKLNKSRLKWKREQFCRVIISYEEVEWEPTTCLSVDSENHLFLAGDGLIPTHNTFSGAHWVKDLVLNKGVRRIALIGPSIADVRDVMVEGSSGIIAVHKPNEVPEYQSSKARVVWPNGAIAKMYSAETPDAIRGANNEAIWGDEISSWKYDDAFDQAMLTLRVGISQALFTTTPKPNKLMKNLFKRAGKDVRLISGSTYDNLDNLSKTFKEQVIAAYEGTRLGKQELEGLLLLDVVGALWTTETIANCIIDESELPEFKKIIIVVDPSGSSKKTADECGLIVAALGVDGLVYILKDATAIMSPADWAAKSVALMDAYGADYIVYEKNYGAEMIQAIYDAIRPNIYLKDIWSKKGKLIRAEGPSLLYEQNKVKHVKGLLYLEEEMTTYDGKGRSPNRLDALVMSVQDLAMGGRGNTITSTEFIL